jgi:hypothetical protein
MDVKQYYRKIHDVELGLKDKYPMVISLETPDGGKAGVVSEVSRALAAKLIVEGRAALASDAEIERYRHEQAEAKRSAEKAELAKRLQVAIIADPEVKNPSGSKKSDSATPGGK